MLGNFYKGIKIIHFSCAIILGQLLQTFGDFYLVTLLLLRLHPKLKSQKTKMENDVLMGKGSIFGMAIHHNIIIIVVLVVSVTRGCWTKKVTQLSLKKCPKSEQRSFHLKSIFSKYPKFSQILGLHQKENLIPLNFQKWPNLVTLIVVIVTAFTLFTFHHDFHFRVEFDLI